MKDPFSPVPISDFRFESPAAPLPALRPLSDFQSARLQSPISAFQNFRFSDFQRNDRVTALRAFTLIELLVVISIIIILMGLLFPAFKGVQDQAKKTQAKNDLLQIVNAVNAYYTEYGRMPIPASEVDGTAGYTYGDTTQGAKHGNDWLFNVLRPMNGLTGDQLNENSKLVSFINPPIAKDPNVPKSGLSTGTNSGQWYDPWGSVYNIRLDSAYSNSVSTNPPYTNAPKWNFVTGSVIAWSYGKDGAIGVNGNGDATASGFDDVLSWQ